MIMGNGKCLCGNQPLCRVHPQFFTKSFLGDGAAWLAPSSGEEPAPTPSSRRRVDGVEVGSDSARARRKF